MSDKDNKTLRLTENVTICFTALKRYNPKNKKMICYPNTDMYTKEELITICNNNLMMILEMTSFDQLEKTFRGILKDSTKEKILTLSRLLTSVMDSKRWKKRLEERRK